MELNDFLYLSEYEQIFEEDFETYSKNFTCFNNDLATLSTINSNILNSNNINNNNNELLNKLEEECRISKKNYDEQLQKYQQLLKDFDKKVNESTQFKTLKKILQEKNTLIVQLKTKISNYEEKK